MKRKKSRKTTKKTKKTKLTKRLKKSSFKRKKKLRAKIEPLPAGGPNVTFQSQNGQNIHKSHPLK